MTTTKASIKGPLYQKLVQFLPIFVNNPFDTDASLNVPKLREAVGLSSEGIYKWFRKNRLAAEHIPTIVELANREDNVKILTTLGRTPPTIEDFHDIFFARA